MTNLIMALSSFTEALSLVDVTLSPLFHYQFSSLFKVLAHLASDEDSRLLLEKDIRRMCMPYSDQSSDAYVLLQTDTTPLCKPHSPTLKERTYISIPNRFIPGNRPLDIGYDVSCVNLSVPESSWSLPLSIRRVPLKQTATDCAIGQLKDVLEDGHLPFKDKLIVNTLDSKYGTSRYLCQTYDFEQLVNITRLRAGMKVWQPYDGPHKGGAPRLYGGRYYLREESGYYSCTNPRRKQPMEVFQRAIADIDAHEHKSFFTQTQKGREIKVQLWRYKNMLIRGKNGYSMKDKPLDILAVLVTDAASGKPIFDGTSYLAICGEQKDHITTESAYEYYRRRYDIEPWLRFIKQRLFLQDYQTPDRDHLENWLLIPQLCSWLLYCASTEANYLPKKWEQYLPKTQQMKTGQRLSIAQTRRAAQTLFLTFEPTLFKPKKCKKGRGRAKGITFTPRKRYQVVKKEAYKQKLVLQLE